jgi:hypothetical protein
MSTRSIRVTVRGAFADLSAEQRAELIARQDEHQFLETVYRPEGHLAYDLAARPFFTFRFLEKADSAAGVAAATARAQAAATAWMDERGYGYRGITAQAVDMSEVPIGARGRREETRRSR